MKWMKKILFMVLMLATLSGAVNVQAAYHKDLTGDFKTHSAKVDLNKDGKKEKITAKFSEKTYYYDLYINNKRLIKKTDGIWLVDTNTRDKYIEIISYNENYNRKLKIYRYNGKKLTLYAYANVDSYLTNLKKKHVYDIYGIDTIRSSGKGNITIYNTLYIPSVTTLDGTTGRCQIGISYKVKKNSIQYDQNSTSTVATDEEMFKATKTWQAYKYPKTKSNKKAFKIKKGEYVEITAMKITPIYTYIKMNKVNMKQSGWVVFLTQDVEKI